MASLPEGPQKAALQVRSRQHEIKSVFLRGFAQLAYDKGIACN